MINLFMSVLIALGVNYLNTFKGWAVAAIVLAFIVQITMLFIQSVEEKHFATDVGHMQKMHGLDHDKDEEAKAIKNSGEIKKLRERVQKVTDKNKEKKVVDPKYYQNVLNLLNRFRERK
ncbi:MAG: hypothetical protein Q7R76_00115 [Candidatus Woesearchaeota archaeon]|nr:hypothetical protein [Candidatus Woesearchaeota archaeon]